MSSLAPSIVEMNNASYMTAIANLKASIASLESERDKLRAEVERLRTHVANLRGAMWHIRYVVVDIEAAKAVARDELGRAIEAAKEA